MGRVPKHIHFKGFDRGAEMSLRDYMERVMDICHEVKAAVGSEISREQSKRFRREVSFDVPFVPKGTFALAFEFKMLAMKQKYIRIFKDEIAGHILPAPPVLLVTPPAPPQTAAALDPSTMLTAQQRKVAKIIERCYEELAIDRLRVQAKNNPQWREAKEAYTDAVVAFTLKEGVSPSTKEEAIWVLRLHGQQ